MWWCLAYAQRSGQLTWRGGGLGSYVHGWPVHHLQAAWGK